MGPTSTEKGYFVRRWRYVAAIGGFLIALALAAGRLLKARTSWTDLREFSGFLADFGLGVLIIAAILLGIFGFGYTLWRMARPNPEKSGSTQRPTTRYWRLVVGFAGLSAVLGIAAAGATASGRSNIGALGWRVARAMGAFGPNLGLGIMLAMAVNGAICFAILWGGYLLWTRIRRSGAKGSAQ
jgi:hypothetical protein